MLITHKKLQPVQCYHIFSNSMVVYLAKNLIPRPLKIPVLLYSQNCPPVVLPYLEHSAYSYVRIETCTV